MIKNIILGTGYLSSNLIKKIENSKIYSSKDFKREIYKFNKSKYKINLIINSFFSSKKLNKVSSYREFVKKTVIEISEVIDNIDPKIINKIIYTSSSSVYGSLNNNLSFEDKNNRSVYSSFKLSAESLVKNFSSLHKINLSICRLFNLYGPKDDFSIISKLLDIKKKNKKILIFNKGKSIRDFIHVDDVTRIYVKILKSKNSGIFDVGTGKGFSIIEIIEKLRIPKRKIVFQNNALNEISYSVANNKELIKKIKFKKFKKIENFLKIKEKLNSVNLINKNSIENNLVGSIIYGAGYSGKKLANQLVNNKKNNIAYFIDDDPNKIGKFINGIKVLSFKDLQHLSTQTNIRNIIIAIPSLKPKSRNSLFNKLLPYSYSVSSLPEKKFYENNKIDSSDIKQLTIDELFNKNDNQTFPIPENLKNKNILVTGGAGSIGAEISNQITKSNPKKLIILDHSEFNIYRLSKKINLKKVKLILGDIKDENLIKNIIKKNNIEFIFHAAAYKHVKFLEQNLYSAVKNNIFGTNSILKAIKNRSSKLIFISTDKAVNPKNVLGITKRVGELLIKLTFKQPGYEKSKFLIVRFGNVIGSDGSALPYFLNQIKKDLPITLTDKRMERYFMTIKEACNLVLQTSTFKYENKILFLDMGKPVKIIDIIKNIFDKYKKKNQKLKLKITGNKFNEKISEKLVHRNKVFKTKIKKVFFLKDQIKKGKKFYDTINQILKETNNFNSNKLIKLLKQSIRFE